MAKVIVHIKKDREKGTYTIDFIGTSAELVEAAFYRASEEAGHDPFKDKYADVYGTKVTIHPTLIEEIGTEGVVKLINSLIERVCKAEHKLDHAISLVAGNMNRKGITYKMDREGITYP